jgi:hypothetical protein
MANRDSVNDAQLEEQDLRRRALFVLAALLLLVSGALNIITGGGFLLDEEAVVPEALPYAEAAWWGWFLILIGAAKVAAGVGLFNRKYWAALVGIVFGSLNLLLHMALLSTYPAQSVLMIVLDTALLWTLVVYGARQPS